MAGVTCDVCQHGNSDANPACERCGTPLRRIAIPAQTAEVVVPTEPAPALPGPGESVSPFDTCEVTATIRAGGRTFSLAPGERLRLGRNPKSPLSGLCTDNVSFDHAELYFDDNELFVVDTNSTNGTFIASTRLQPGVPHRLHDAVTISLATAPRLDVEVEISNS